MNLRNSQRQFLKAKSLKENIVMFPRKPMIQDQHKEALDSVVSYGIGGGSALMATLMNITSEAQALAIIFGCFVVFIRLVHDTVKLFRFIRDGKDE